MLLETAVGDAYGAGFEYVRDREFIREHNDLCGYVQHPRHKQKAGTYTDDTQMSIAVAELVISEKVWSPEIIADRFLESFHRDERKGYAGGFYEFLKKTKTGAEFLTNIRPTSDKSGAAMRAAPIGFYQSIEEVVSRCSMQADLTHNTPDGRNAAVAVSLMAHYFIYDLGPKSKLPDFLCCHVPGNWAEPWLGEVGSKGWMSVRAAITSLMKHDSLSAVLKSCISWGGDVDTVAAVAMAAGSCSREISKDLPEGLVSRLENGTYGRDYLRDLDKALQALIKARKI